MKNQRTEIMGIGGFDPVFIEKITHICKNIDLAGFDPYSQLTGYLLTNNELYITRTGNARDMIRTLDHVQLMSYVNEYLKNNSKYGG